MAETSKKTATQSIDDVLLPKIEDQQPLSVVENLGISETAHDATAAINANAAASNQVTGGNPIYKPTSSGAGGGGGRPAWHDEPLSSFQLDNDGKVKLHPRTRKPIRHDGKGGRPRKAKPGDKLAGGGVASAPGSPGSPGTGSGFRAIVDHDATPGVTPHQVNPHQDGEDAAKVIVDLADNVAKQVVGEEAGMNAAEKATIAKGTASMTGGLTLWGPFLLLAGLSAWAARLWFVFKKKGNQPDVDDTRGDHRVEQKRQVYPG